AAAGLGVLLAAINLSQGDDMALSKSEQLFSLDDSLDAKICGDKAARLSQLKRANFNVPSGWILLNESGIGHRASGIGHRASGIGHSENSENLSIPNSLIENLKSQIANRMIVRSSAAGEDGDISSAAGQYETIGPVSTEAELIAGIHRCRQSYWTSEAVSYRQQRQLPDTQMAVLIQPYIEGKVAGVMFSRNPLDGGSQIIIEALPGGAESVVGGQVTPLHLEVDFTQPEILQQTLNELEINSIVNPKLLAELVKQAQAIEAFFHGIPQDIEWSWDGEKVWILQSRPITNLQPFWTRTIAAEVIPGAIRPLTWSINRPLTCGVWGEIFRVVLADRAAHLNFNETATLLGSHAYFNATLLGEIFRMMGLPEQGLEFLLRGQKMGKPPLGKILPSLPGLWRLVQRERALNADFAGDRTSIFLPAIESLEKSEKEEGRRKREEGRGKNEEGILIPNAQFPIPNAQFPMPNAPCPMPHAQFPMPNYQDLSELLDKSEQIQKWLKPITYYNILGPIGLAIRKAIFRVDDDWLVNDTAPEIASVRALQELAEKLREVAIYQSGENVSAAQLAQIFTESLALQADFEQWLDIYGYLSEVGTDIAVPTWREQPETYRKLLVTMAQKSAVANSAATGKLSLTFAQKWRLNKCQERAIVKSQISEIYARLLAHLRWTFLAIEACGLEMQVFQEPGDIFYLEFGEIQQWIRSGASVSFQETISLRRDRLLADRDRPIPPVVYGNLLPNSQKRSI
ncbi:MAG: PEP-utilizing protein, partial [Oscillatoriales cyanobacterium]